VMESLPFMPPILIFRTSLGFPKTLNAIAEINDVFKARQIALPIESQKQVEEDNRFNKGLAVQVEIFGDVIVKNQWNAPSRVS
jgi:4-carboxymuconolactone decarboxylase